MARFATGTQMGVDISGSDGDSYLRDLGFRGIFIISTRFRTQYTVSTTLFESDYFTVYSVRM